MLNLKLAIKNRKEYTRRYKRYIPGGMLLFGFIVDNFTLTRVDLWFDNLVLLTYLVIALMGILFINLYETQVLQSEYLKRFKFLSTLAVQFAFGGLFSGFIVFYSRSASFITSWPFILILVALLFGNEFFKDRYSKFNFQMSIFFTALFSFMIFYVPVIVGVMGAWVFLYSGFLSLAIISLIIYIFLQTMPRLVDKAKLVWSISTIFIVINLLYFTNIIPPIPLSLKYISTYHYVQRLENGNYYVNSEKKKIYDFLIFNNTVHISHGSPVYIYSAVFAPTRLNTDIFHKWQYYDNEKSKWIEKDSIKFNISGGRDGGYRGYTMKTNLKEGVWRVDVITPRNQLIGRIKFKVNASDEPVALSENILHE